MSYVYAIDCEMVGDIQNQSMLARVSLVNSNLDVLIDDYVSPTKPIGDYRTIYSGIQPGYENRAKPKNQVVRQIKEIIAGNILVGYDVQKDLEVLGLTHDRVKDLSTHRPLLSPNGSKRSLKELAMSVLGKSIQNGPHDSVEDAKATMEIYLKYRF